MKKFIVGVLLVVVGALGGLYASKFDCVKNCPVLCHICSCKSCCESCPVNVKCPCVECPCCEACPGHIKLGCHK